MLTTLAERRLLAPELSVRLPELYFRYQSEAAGREKEILMS